MLHLLCWPTAALLLASVAPALGIQIVENDSSALSGIASSGCRDALTRDVACSRAVTALRPGAYYAEKLLNATCTANCSQALAEYQAAVDAACRGHTFHGEAGPLTPVLMIPDLLRYLYNRTCLTDSGRFSNVVAAEAAMAVDDEVPLGMVGRCSSPPQTHRKGLAPALKTKAELTGPHWKLSSF